MGQGRRGRECTGQGRAGGRRESEKKNKRVSEREGVCEREQGVCVRERERGGQKEDERERESERERERKRERGKKQEGVSERERASERASERESRGRISKEKSVRVESFHPHRVCV